jgi:hypothetical protein
MLSISIAELPEPDTTVVMCPEDCEVANTTISPAVICDCQLPVWPAGPLNATIHSPLATPGVNRLVLVIGSEAPASAEMLLASTQQPLSFQALPTKLCAALLMDLGVAWLGAGPTKLGWVTTDTLPT